MRNHGKPWSPGDESDMRRLYPTNEIRALEKIFGRSEKAITAKAHKLGLAKDDDYTPPRRGCFEKGQQPWNKGVPFSPPGSEKGRFKPGQKPHTWLPIGSERVTKEGYLQRKMTDTGYPPHDWVEVQRIVWEEHFGPIPDGLYVCHRCDNPACVNPSHLFLGTPLQNTQDMHSKGRQRYVGQKGRRNPRAELSEKQVKQIIGLIAKGHTNKSIAHRFGVSHSTISLIRLGKSWAEIPRPNSPKFKAYQSLAANNADS